MVRAPSFIVLAACLLLTFTISPALGQERAPDNDAVDRPAAVPVGERLVVQTTVGIAASAAVPIALLTTAQVIGTLVVKWDLPLSYAAAGAITLGSAALAVPGIAVGRVGARLGGDKHTLATILGGLAGYGVTALANVAYWSVDQNLSAPLMLGSWMVPGLTSVLAYQLAEWLD